VRETERGSKRMRKKNSRVKGDQSKLKHDFPKFHKDTYGAKPALIVVFAYPTGI
jgi:hypothetical protein